MSDKTIEIKSIQGVSDYGALRTYFMHKRDPKRTKITAGILLASILLLVFDYSIYPFLLFKIIGIIGIIAIAGIYSWLSIETRRLEKNIKPLINIKQEIGLTQAGFAVKWAGFELADYSWDEIYYSYESDFHFFIFIDKYFAVILPKILMKKALSKEIHDLLESKTRLIDDSTGWKYDTI
ncbi:hypothetical protein MASR2M70_16130 [Bacillota bacterium]